MYSCLIKSPLRTHGTSGTEFVSCAFVLLSHTNIFGVTIYVFASCHNEDGRIQLRKESLLQEVIHSEKLNRAFRRTEAELP